MLLRETFSTAIKRHNGQFVKFRIIVEKYQQSFLWIYTLLQTFESKFIKKIQQTKFPQLQKIKVCQNFHFDVIKVVTAEHT